MSKREHDDKLFEKGS